MKKGFFIYVGIIVVLALVFLCLKKDNIFRWIEAGITVQRQQKQIEMYEAQIRSLEEKTKALSSDRDSLEKFARETYNFSAPGEDVFIVDDK